MRGVVTLLLAGFISAWSGGLHAATFTVNSSNDVDDGTCDATHCSLRDALRAANAATDADLIVFSIDNTTVNMTGGEFRIVHPVTIR